jgi:polar amino acid transport system permease protein
MESSLDLAHMILSGIGVTLLASFSSFIFGFPLAIVILCMRVSGKPPLRSAAILYVSFMRGTPALLQVLLAYYVVPSLLNINLPPLAAGILALAMNTAAFTSEALRGSLSSIPSGQRAAARSLGMNRLVEWRYVVLPQVLYRALPPLTSEFGIMFKATSLLSVISVADMASVSRELSTSTHQPLVIYSGAAAAYFVILFIVSMISRHLETKVARYLPNGV